MKRTGWAVGAGIGVVVLAVAAKEVEKRVRRAVDAYVKEVSSGSKPIEGVGTAVAAFVGLEPPPPK
jgi:hypothetical protein